MLFELISARYERRFTLITANQPFGAWGKVFPDLAMTLAALAYRAPVMNVVVVGTFLLMFYRLLSSKMPVNPDLKTVVIGMIITVQTAFAGAVGYWIGSSAGSAAKDRRSARGQ